MHTEAMIRDGDWRVRHTDRDNAPIGREVHWSSGLMWVLAFLAWLIHLASGMTVINAVQHAALIAGPFMLVGFVIAFSLIAARRWGGLVGGFLGLAIVTMGPFDSSFFAGEADHHGIVGCFILGCVLAIIAAGGGRVRREGATQNPHAMVPARASARRWMIFSGLCGAAGLWVSAATVVPAFAGIALGALLAAWMGRKSSASEETVSAPELWRIWGVSGALGSLAFYLLEYAPSHLGWRLEVNHPLYALALLGSGDLLARLCVWIQGGRFAPTPRAKLCAAMAVFSVLVLPAVILIGGTRVFTISDTFLWSLHKDYIIEFQTLSKAMANATWKTYLTTLPIWPLLIIPGQWLLLRTQISSEAKAPLSIALCAAFPLSVLSFLQIRWIGSAMLLWLSLATVLLIFWCQAVPRPTKRATIFLTTFFMVGLVTYPAFCIPRWFASTRDRHLEEAITQVMRDVAWQLRVSARGNPINIVSGPTTTTNLAFYGDTNGVGTLYWENTDGLKAVGSIYGAKSQPEALELCRQHQVTHIVIFSWDAFAQPYARLHHGRPVNATTDDCFVSSLLNTRSIPTWLRPIPYKMLPALAKLGHGVIIFEVHPEQTEAEALFYLGKYLQGIDNPSEALKAFIQSWNLNNNTPGLGVDLGLALVAAGRIDEVTQLCRQLASEQLLPVETALGLRLASDGAHRAAVETLRRVWDLDPGNRKLATQLSWLLATSSDDSVRDGGEAMRLMKRLAASSQMNLDEVDAYAAAYAETGDFGQALNLVDQALVVAHKDGLEQVIKNLEARRIRYLAHLPFRVDPKPQSAPVSP